MAFEATVGSTRIHEIAGFELIRKIGQGGMGAVFLARQRSMERDVALKILPPSVAKDKAFIERFIREARATAKLNHANIVCGIDVGQDPKTMLWYFAMEFIDGPSALALLKEKGVLPERQVLEIARDILKALDYANRQGFVHRDIKPDNILLTKTGQAKLADLGLVRQTQDDASMTQSGLAVGTPHYMAPEQAKGSKQIDIRADLYALGATLFHLVTGTRPFTGETGAVVMVKHLTEPPPYAREVKSGVSERFSAMIERLMQKAPQDRYQTPDQVLVEVETMLSGKTATAVKTQPVSSIPGRHTTGPREVISRKAPRALRETPKSKPAPTLAIVAGVAVVLVVGGVLLSMGGGSKGARPTQSVSRVQSSEQDPSLAAAQSKAQEQAKFMQRIDELAATNLADAQTYDRFRRDANDLRTELIKQEAQELLPKLDALTQAAALKERTEVVKPAIEESKIAGMAAKVDEQKESARLKSEMGESQVEAPQLASRQVARVSPEELGKLREFLKTFASELFKPDGISSAEALLTKALRAFPDKSVLDELKALSSVLEELRHREAEILKVWKTQQGRKDFPISMGKEKYLATIDGVDPDQLRVAFKDKGQSIQLTQKFSTMTPEQKAFIERPGFRETATGYLAQGLSLIFENTGAGTDFTAARTALSKAKDLAVTQHYLTILEELDEQRSQVMVREAWDAYSDKVIARSADPNADLSELLNELNAFEERYAGHAFLKAIAKEREQMRKLLDLLVQRKVLSSERDALTKKMQIPTEGVVKFEGRTYKFYAEPKTWQQAQEFCSGLGGNLVCLNSRAKVEFLTKLLQPLGVPAILVGARKTEEGVRWFTGESPPELFLKGWEEVAVGTGGYARTEQFRTHGIQPVASEMRLPFICEWRR